MPVPEPADPNEQLRTRIAWLYYVEGRTQSEVAEIVGLSRVRVNRELAVCRERGIVQIRINAKLADCIALERRLVTRFGLKDAVVVPKPGDPAIMPQVIGAVAGHYVSDRLAESMSVGVGWGRTLHASLKAIERRPLKGLSVVSLMGGLTRASAINTYETASRFADLFDAECYYLAAPTFTSDAESRATFLHQAAIREVMERAERVDLALVSVGDLEPGATIRQLGLITDEDAASLLAAGAVGDILGHYLDAKGLLVDHPINERVIGLSPDKLAAVPTAVLASAGRTKVPMIGAALGAGFVNVLITDTSTAETLLRG